MRKLSPQALLCLAMISVGMGQSVIFAELPVLGRELALDQIILRLPFLSIEYPLKELAITSLSALTALTFSLVSPFWGRLSDRVGRKPIIVIGLLGYTVGMVLFTLVSWWGLKAMVTGFHLYLLIVLARFLHSLVMSASFPASSAFMVDISPPQLRAKALGRMAAFMQIGVMCGPALAYLMVYGFLTPFIVQGAITLLAGMTILLFFPKTQPATNQTPRKRLAYWNPQYRIYLLVALTFYISMGMVQQTLGFYFQDVLHLARMEAAKTYAVAMMVSSAAMLFAQFVVVQNFAIRAQNLVRVGLPFACIGFFVLAFAKSLVVLFFGMALFGFALGLVGPSISAAASMAVDAKDQGALAGLVGSVAGFGFVIGPLVGGAIYGFSMQLPYYLAALMLLLVAVYVLLQRLPGEKV